MADAMHIERLEALLFDDLVQGALKDSEVEHSLGKHLDRGLLQEIEASAWTSGFEDRLLGVVDDPVEIALGGGEASADGKGPGDVAAILLQARSGVDQDECVVGDRLVVGDIVQDGGVATSGRNGWEGDGIPAVIEEGLLDRGMHLAFVESGPDVLDHCAMGGGTELTRAAVNT